MQNDVKKLFVYGTLRSGFHHPAYSYISKYFQQIGSGLIKGLLFDLGEYPAAITTTGNFFITGELYELKDGCNFDLAIEQLDEYEGLYPEEGDTQLFRRELTEVNYNNFIEQAWVYWYNQRLTGIPITSTENIFDYMIYKNTL